MVFLFYKYMCIILICKINIKKFFELFIQFYLNLIIVFYYLKINEENVCKFNPINFFFKLNKYI
jgi:hypothetical protein